MLYLLAAIICSTAIALILKHGEEKKHNRFIILAMNYTMATSASLWFVLSKNLHHSFSNLSLSSLGDQLRAGHAGTDGFLSEPATALWALIVGIPTGILYFLGFYCSHGPQYGVLARISRRSSVDRNDTGSCSYRYCKPDS